jgi:hypothetical protein
MAVATVISLGCSLDWEVRAPGEGGVPESSPPEVSVADTGVDAPDDVAAEASDADPCGALRAAVVSARAKARKCTFGSAIQCKTSVQDECDCPVVVSVAGSTEATAYAQAATDLRAAGCVPAPPCAATCPSLPVMGLWQCVSTDLCSP